MQPQRHQRTKNTEQYHILSFFMPESPCGETLLLGPGYAELVRITQALLDIMSLLGFEAKPW